MTAEEIAQLKASIAAQLISGEQGGTDVGKIRTAIILAVDGIAPKLAGLTGKFKGVYEDGAKEADTYWLSGNVLWRVKMAFNSAVAPTQNTAYWEKYLDVASLESRITSAEGALSLKVDKSGTKQLSDENYTLAEKSKLSVLSNIIVEDSLASVSATNALSAKQGGILSGWIGTLGNLATTAKDSLVAAINELKTGQGLKADKSLSVFTLTGTANVLTAAHNGALVLVDNASGNTLSVGALGAGFQCIVKQKGAGQINLTTTGGVTLDHPDGFLKSRKQKATFTIFFESAAVATVAGDLTA
ncbi:hypothetical protein GU926_08250 [Nibribacter ruber]|uniref:Uncharacterized protein n=1 Tax=Nibribacter ruber TaxID=2698458 RepID=A0A6P1NUL9_9BACT|nr:hypothetical protein [Nibribacter ruber]QHL87427.1 hypothetical protein GU926_08250 [Nibribacter ruber]